MAQVSRRQVLLGGGALLGSTMFPGAGLVQTAFGEEIPRPDYLIRAGFNENPWGPSRVALKAIVESIKLSNLYGGNRQALVDLMGQAEPVHVSLGIRFGG